MSVSKQMDFIKDGDGVYQFAHFTDPKFSLSPGKRELRGIILLPDLRVKREKEFIKDCQPKYEYCDFGKKKFSTPPPKEKKDLWFDNIPYLFVKCVRQSLRYNKEKRMSRETSISLALKEALAIKMRARGMIPEAIEANIRKKARRRGGSKHKHYYDPQSKAYFTTRTREGTNYLSVKQPDKGVDCH